MPSPRRPAACAVLLTVLTGCGTSPPDVATTDAAGITRLRVEVLDTRPHDRGAFTQGLELADGVLFESTGLEGRSTARRTDPETGEVTASVPLDPSYFAEGLTLAGDTLWQLTWRDGVAIRRDPTTLAETGRADYAGEGWGLCAAADGRLVMSDGTDRLTFRDPVDFTELGEVAVTIDGRPLTYLNELECVDGTVWANVWQTDRIVRIDPATGVIDAMVDATGLLPAADRPGADVLNGIAHIPGTDHFLLTGKLWPTTFEVRFVPS